MLRGPPGLRGPLPLVPTFFGSEHTRDSPPPRLSLWVRLDGHRDFKGRFPKVPGRAEQVEGLEGPLFVGIDVRLIRFAHLVFAMHMQP